HLIFTRASCRFAPKWTQPWLRCKTNPIPPSPAGKTTALGNCGRWRVMVKLNPALSAAHRQPMPARLRRWLLVRPGSLALAPSHADKPNRLAATVDQRPDVLHLNDSPAITSCRTQGPLKNQTHIARRQGL